MKIGDNVFVVINHGSYKVEGAEIVGLKHSVNMAFYEVRLKDNQKIVAVSKQRIFANEIEAIKCMKELKNK